MIKHKHRMITTALIVVICALISYLYLISYNKIGRIYQDETQDTIVEIKKSFLKNTVDNLIYEIETDIKTETDRYKRNVIRRYEILLDQKYISDDEFIDNFISRFKFDSKDPNMDYWTVLLWDNSNNRLLYDPDELFAEDIATTLKKIEPDMSYYKEVVYGQISGFIGVSSEYIEDKIKESTANKIRNLKFENGSYVWVNEVINYAGGKDYAIRRVHPNLIDTEGMHLSTDMTDIKGNHPYLTELEGVKKDGEIFFSYYFKELNKNTISEKLTYAKLFKEYDWIIAMGDHINEIQQYISQTNEKSKEMAAALTLQLEFLLIVVAIICLILLVLLENWYFKRIKKQMELEINKDPLTKAGSRRYGAIVLTRDLKEFKKNGSNPTIMMFDIDNFKGINDHYGHDVGDQILKEVVNVIYQTIRSSDKLIRWGGDEFICILYGLKRDNALILGRKILEVVSSLRIPIGNEVIIPTISMGISYFEEDDDDITDVLKRADQAMYRSKTEGRNRAILYNFEQA